MGKDQEKAKEVARKEETRKKRAEANEKVVELSSKHEKKAEEMAAEVAKKGDLKEKGAKAQKAATDKVRELDVKKQERDTAEKHTKLVTFINGEKERKAKAKVKEQEEGGVKEEQ